MGQPNLETALGAHRQLLWGLCYRMSGCAADADDLVQDTMERALRTPPEDLKRDLEPWLVRVAMNVSRDHLRRRRRRTYPGPWLAGPATVQQGALVDPETPDTHYGQSESVSIAFLHAMEALTPGQRAVLILRDVLGHTVRETGQALELTEGNVKTTHHRARQAMASYDRKRTDLSSAGLARHRRALEALMVHLATGNVAGLEALLSEDVRARNDSDPKHFAARRDVTGRHKVILFHLKVNKLHLTRELGRARFRVTTLNGEPALLAIWPSRDPRVPERMVIRIALDGHGRICELDTVVAERKLAGLNFDSLPRYPAAWELIRALTAAATWPPPRRWVGTAARRILGQVLDRRPRKPST